MTACRRSRRILHTGAIARTGSKRIIALQQRIFDPTQRDRSFVREHSLAASARCRCLGWEGWTASNHVQNPACGDQAYPSALEQEPSDRSESPAPAKTGSGHSCEARTRGQLADLALFNLATDSKLRGCDLVRLKVTDLVSGGSVRDRVSVIQSKTGRPVQFEVSENTRGSVLEWVASPAMLGCGFLFPSRFHGSPHLSTRQYARLVRERVSAIGLGPSGYGTHSLRRTKAALIYRSPEWPD